MSSLPKWARPTIENYNRTKTLPGKGREMLDADEAGASSKELTSSILEGISYDNNPDHPQMDINPAEGIVETVDSFLGPIKTIYDPSIEGAGNFESAVFIDDSVMYSKNTARGLDAVFVSPDGEARALHVNYTNLAQSFEIG